MLARRIAASAFAAVLAAPAAAHAGHVVRHASEGPSATPLIVELVAAALVAVIAVTRKPLARFARATVQRVGARLNRRVTKPARVSER